MTKYSKDGLQAIKKLSGRSGLYHVIYKTIENLSGMVEVVSCKQIATRATEKAFNNACALIS